MTFSEEHYAKSSVLGPSDRLEPSAEPDCQVLISGSLLYNELVSRLYCHLWTLSLR